jgi:hypothetical protein
MDRVASFSEVTLSGDIWSDRLHLPSEYAARGRAHPRMTSLSYGVELGFHYMGGSGESVQVPLSVLDNGGYLDAVDFPGFEGKVAAATPNSTQEIELTLTVQTGSLSTGESTLVLSGTLSTDANGNSQFRGMITGEPEPYDFSEGGFQNWVGRHLPGAPFWVYYVGSRAAGYR